MQNLTKEEREKLELLCLQLNDISVKQGVSLRLIETKGTIYFFPELE